MNPVADRQCPEKRYGDGRLLMSEWAALERSPSMCQRSSNNPHLWSLKTPHLLIQEGSVMSDTLLEGRARLTADTGPEVTPLGEGRMVREDAWREVHRLFHSERRSKSDIA